MNSRGLLFASLASLLAACSGSAPTMESTGSSDEAVTQKCGASTTGAVQGRDVSVYQGNFDWSAQKAAGVVFGYARISDGTGSVDSQFDGNWSKMKAAGILRGAYQFFEPGEDATAQANMVVSKVGMLGAGDLPAMIDVEVTGGQSGATIASKVQTWIDVVEKGTGRHPVIYSGSYFWQDNVGSTAFGSTPFWVAAYGTSCPSLPPGWSNWSFWQYSDGNGSLDHDVFNGTLAELEAMAQPPDQAPRGYLDAADCTKIAGWAQDQDTPAQSIDVDLYFDGAAGSGAPAFRTHANQTRQDLCTAIGSCDHGYSVSVPASLLDGKPHTVRAYGIDSSTAGDNALLADAPKSFTCALPAMPTNVVRRWVTNPTSFAAWSFDAFREISHYPQAAVDLVPKGADVPAKPSLVEGEGDPAVYVMDGAVKRHVVSPASMAAWAFDWNAIAKVPAAQIAATATGPDWPVSPTLVQGSGAEVDMLDVAPATSGAAEGADAGSGMATANGGSGSNASSGSGDSTGTATADGSASGASSGGCAASPKSESSGAIAWLGIAMAAMMARRRRSQTRV